MGFLDAIKDRLIGRKDDDLEDIRSYVTDDKYEQDFQSNLAPQDTPPQKSWEKSPDPNQDFTQPQDQLAFSQPPESRRDLSVGSQNQGDYDIIDKLNMIESQLAAIRSQTETINERLKNMEMKAGRRF